MIKILFVINPLYLGPGLLKFLFSKSGLSLIFVRTGLLQLFSNSLDEIVVLPKCRKVSRMALDNVRPRQYIEVETHLIVEKLYFSVPLLW